MSADLPPIGTIFAQLAIVAGLVLVNGFFVASEFALVSVRRTRIDQLAAEGMREIAIAVYPGWQHGDDKLGLLLESVGFRRHGE